MRKKLIMGQIIAIAGKGGTGKTTLASLIVRTLKEQNSGSILAIDADPNNTLGQTLGVKDISTIVEIVDNISKNLSEIPAGMTKDRFLDMKIQESINEEPGFDLLSMGRPEGPGCYCFINNLLRDLIERLMKNYSYIIVDNEAGMEHLSRRLVRKIDRLFMTSDSSIIGIRSAARISKLIDDLNITVKDRGLVLNKLKVGRDTLNKEIERSGLEMITTLPFDEEIEVAAIGERSIFEIASENRLLNLVKDHFKLAVTK
ncbi:MAG: AAA family ATPase [Candidatus Omnitrophota bacterium]